jgi:lambda repressor-like predicted transcriptional regulator
VPRRLVVLRGRGVTLTEAAAAAGVAYGTLCKRLERGWPLERALCCGPDGAP